MVQVKVWVRRALTLVALGGVVMSAAQEVKLPVDGLYGPGATPAGDDPKIYTGG